MRATRLLLGVGLLGAGLALRRARRAPPPKVVDHLELGRYMGRWYEIARLPTRFERDCRQGVAMYHQLDDRRIEVLNSCASKGGVREVRGTARVVDPTTCARLKIRFRGPFSGDYQVLHVDEGYTHACVGSASRRHGWILSRRPTIEDDVLYARLVQVLADQGYDVERLVRVDRQKTPGSTNRPPDPVDQAGRESFPASDPPSYTPGHAK